MKDHRAEGANVTGRICVSISANTLEGLAESISKTGNRADLIELRIDALDSCSEAELTRLIASASVPVICTCRHVTEGGGWHGDESVRLNMLAHAASSGAAYVDIELGAGPDAITHLHDSIQGSDCGLIVSFHDFTGTPKRNFLIDVMSRQQEAGADICKIVVMAKHLHDVQVPLSLYHEADSMNLVLVAFSMGSSGRISRIAGCAMGAPFTFAAPDQGEATAPGQMAVSEMRKLFSLLF